MSRELIVILDFGSQYTQLIARRIREKSVYCEIHPYNMPVDKLRRMPVKGIVLSGGPSSVYGHEAPICESELFELGVPVLGICYGMQLMAYLLGGQVEQSQEHEYGLARLKIDQNKSIFAHLSESLDAWMSHCDRIANIPEGFQAIAHTANCPVAAMADFNRDFYGLQFHPEVIHTKDEDKIFDNFVHDICGCSSSWTMSSFIETEINEIRRKTRGQRVLCAVSGGVDSTTLATLLKKAVGDKLVCIFVNNGVLRKNEPENVLSALSRVGIDAHYVDASEQFLARLTGVVSPEKKRKLIGKEFIAVFEKELDELGKIDFLAQGTLYPDVIESVSVKGPSATIKTHHNVGGLPDVLPFELIEPFRELFKDEVREVAKELGLPKEVWARHPFPGPGLAIRVIGEVTEDRLSILREADAIFIDEIRKGGIYDEIWQALAVLLPVRSVGVMGDQRTYENVIALRAVTSTDGMTADWARIPSELLAQISNRIINEVRGVNRVVYDVSSKPPSTIEWE